MDHHPCCLYAFNVIIVFVLFSSVKGEGMRADDMESFETASMDTRPEPTQRQPLPTSACYKIKVTATAMVV